MRLTDNAPNGLDVDLLNAFRLMNSGFNMATMEDASMPDSEFNALAFAHANDINQFVFSPEWAIAFQENIVDIVGVNHWFDNPIQF